jgi:hypothetical protein
MQLRTGHFLLAAALAVGLAALPASAAAKEKKSKGGSHSMTGCLQKGDDASTYRLTSVEGKGPKTVDLMAASGVDLAPHVGHKVTITGTAMNMKSAAKADGAATAKKEGKEHHMNVEAVKMVAATCP